MICESYSTRHVLERAIDNRALTEVCRFKKYPMELWEKSPMPCTQTWKEKWKQLNDRTHDPNTKRLPRKERQCPRSNVNATATFVY